jgi:serine/threonine protein kinase
VADRYVLERELGSGGMATVYLARDLRHERLVALKVLRPELAATLGPERFLREIKLAAQLQHPHILPVHDSGEAGGFLYYVMPYVEGENLRTRLARHGELPIHDAVKILLEVTDALVGWLLFTSRGTCGTTDASRPEFATDGRRLFFTLSEREADIWELMLNVRR